MTTALIFIKKKPPILWRGAAPDLRPFGNGVFLHDGRWIRFNTNTGLWRQHTPSNAMRTTALIMGMPC